MTKEEAKAMYKATVKSITDAGFVVTRGHGILTKKERDTFLAEIEANTAKLSLGLAVRSS